MTTSVVLSCKFPAGRGQFRTHNLWFIGNDQGYKIWSHIEGPYRFLLKQTCQPFAWRPIVADLQELSRVGLGGAPLTNIEVQGVDGSVAALLKMAWCKSDSPAGVQLRLLLLFDDNTIAALAKGLGDFSDDAFSRSPIATKK